MSTIKSSNEHLTLNADGSGKDIKFQSNGTEVASISDGGVVTATTFTGAATDATKLPLAGGTTTGNIRMNNKLSFNAAANDSAQIFLRNTVVDDRALYIEGDETTAHTAEFYNNVAGSGRTGNVLRVYQDGASAAGSALFVHSDGDTSAIFSGGNVGIGTTSPTAPLHIQNAPGNNTTDSLYIYSTNGAAQLRMEGGGDEWIFNTNYNQNQLDIKNKSGSGSTNTRVSILSGGDVTIGAGNLVIGTSGKGIDFSATSNTSAPLASMSNELLDDYEEGSWSPYITTNGAVYTTTGRGMSGFYTKIGRQVTCYWSCSITTPTGGSGAVRLNNFPFTNANANHIPSTSIRWGRTTLAGQPMYGMMEANSTQMWFEYSNSNGNPTQMPASAMNQTTPYHDGCVTYYVD